LFDLLTRTSGSGRTITHQCAVEDAVLPFEIERLPDLTGF
jgi:hypothetical protein